MLLLVKLKSCGKLYGRHHDLVNRKRNDHGHVTLVVITIQSIRDLSSGFITRVI